MKRSIKPTIINSTYEGDATGIKSSIKSLEDFASKFETFSNNNLL